MKHSHCNGKTTASPCVLSPFVGTKASAGCWCFRTLLSFDAERTADLRQCSSLEHRPGRAPSHRCTVCAWSEAADAPSRPWLDDHLVVCVRMDVQTRLASPAPAAPLRDCCICLTCRLRRSLGNQVHSRINVFLLTEERQFDA